MNTRVYTPDDVRAVPLGVYYVAAVLKDNRYDVEILNWHNIDTTPHKIREVLEEKKPDLVGFSILNANRWGGGSKLPGFVAAIRLIDNEDLYPQHSRFFSRLAMTFDHGDYSAMDVIKHKDRLVEKLYRLSLNY